MHSEAIGSVWTFSIFFEIFWIFESFFNVSGRNFYKRLFHGTIAIATAAAATMMVAMAMAMAMTIAVAMTMAVCLWCTH